jgi:putative DNA modification/repair radical SAM protein
MELMINTLATLRNQYGFNGYIHAKLIPGADPLLINRAGLLADRVSVNIELPSRKSLRLLAPEKKIDSIITPMKSITQKLITYKSERAVLKHVPVFAPAGQSTQLVIGATLDSDYQIMALSSWLYKKMNLKRVYYSAYVPLNEDKNLPKRIPNLLTREHRLYQADWLLRFYGFSAEELFQKSPYYLDQNCDPKLSWALKNPGYFPVEINYADYKTLLRVPGLGVISGKKILALRKVKKITFEDLPKLGIVMKRAKYFITVQGKSTGFLSLSPETIRRKILGPESEAVQLNLFSSYPQFEQPANNSILAMK